MHNFTRFLIRFEKHDATALRDIPPDAPPSHVLDALELPPYDGVVVLEAAAANMPSEIYEATLNLFTQGLVPFANHRHLLVIDGGTNTGGSMAMGEARQAGGGSFSLLGICPAHNVAYSGGPDPGDSHWPLNGDHTHFALVNGHNFGDESDLLVGMIRGSHKRGVAIVINGRLDSPLVRYEIPLHARQGNPLIAVRGSGGAADALLDPQSDLFQMMPAGSRITAADVNDPLSLINAVRRIVG